MLQSQRRMRLLGRVENRRASALGAKGRMFQRRTLFAVGPPQIPTLRRHSPTFILPRRLFSRSVPLHRLLAAVLLSIALLPASSLAAPPPNSRAAEREALKRALLDVV